MGEFFAKFFDTTDFPARWRCGNWSEFLGWLHICSDLAIFAAYFAIPAVLVYFIRKRDDFPFSKLFWLFGGFILACGTTHLIEAIIFWSPIYRVSAMMKFFTALVSWQTIFVLARYTPRILHVPSLAATNDQLRSEIERRKLVESELIAAKEDLQNQKRELELIYESAPVGMSLVGQDRRFIRLNNRLAEINGMAKDDHVGRSLREVLPELSNDLSAMYQQVFNSGVALLDREVTGKTPSSEHERTWLVSYYPLFGEDKVVESVSSIVQDITDRKLIEQRLRESEAAALAASQSKSEFLANMSHEIRTPMAAILGYADVLLGHLEDPDNRNCVMIMKTNGEHLLSLINDILDLSRIEAGKLDVELQECELPQLIADIESLMQVRAAEKKVSFRVEFDGLVPRRIQTDPMRLRQVLINLVGNAIKFTHEGEVCLKVSFIDAADPPVVEVAIVDTGIGIAREQQDRLFKPFSQADTSVTRKYGGSGLGLAISQRLVEMLSGEINFESEFGKGSTFYLRVPVGSLDPIELIKPDLVISTTEPGLSVSDTPNLSCRILVVDDRRDVRHISQHFLEKAGAKVSTAEDGQQGIDASIAARDKGEPFDLVVMDMQMPNVDGLQAVAALRTAGIEWPIIALTADAMKGDRDKCLNGGCDDYLSKPIDQAKLISMAAKYTQAISPDELRRARAERVQALKATLMDDSLESKTNL
jgi:PAS domain S-box-containing protein